MQAGVIMVKEGNVRLGSDEAAGTADNSDMQAAAICTKSAPLAQPVKAPAPQSRSGIACLSARSMWPELTVSTSSSRRTEPP